MSSSSDAPIHVSSDIMDCLNNLVKAIDKKLPLEELKMQLFAIKPIKLTPKQLDKHVTIAHRVGAMVFEDDEEEDKHQSSKRSKRPKERERIIAQLSYALQFIGPGRTSAAFASGLEPHEPNALNPSFHTTSSPWLDVSYNLQFRNMKYDPPHLLDMVGGQMQLAMRSPPGSDEALMYFERVVELARTNLYPAKYTMSAVVLKASSGLAPGSPPVSSNPVGWLPADLVLCPQHDQIDHLEKMYGSAAVILGGNYNKLGRYSDAIELCAPLAEISLHLLNNKGAYKKNREPGAGNLMIEDWKEIKRDAKRVVVEAQIFLGKNVPLCSFGRCPQPRGLKLKECGGCGAVAYCSIKCQRADWKVHKMSCVKKPEVVVADPVVAIVVASADTKQEALATTPSTTPQVHDQRFSDVD